MWRDEKVVPLQRKHSKIQLAKWYKPLPSYTAEGYVYRIYLYNFLMSATSSSSIIISTISVVFNEVLHKYSNIMTVQIRFQVSSKLLSLLTLKRMKTRKKTTKKAATTNYHDRHSPGRLSWLFSFSSDILLSYIGNPRLLPESSYRFVDVKQSSFRKGLPATSQIFLAFSGVKNSR